MCSCVRACLFGTRMHQVEWRMEHNTVFILTCKLTYAFVRDFFDFGLGAAGGMPRALAEIKSNLSSSDTHTQTDAPAATIATRVQVFFRLPLGNCIS